MPSLQASVKRPDGLIECWRKRMRFKKEYIDFGRECYIGANI